MLRAQASYRSCLRCRWFIRVDTAITNQDGTYMAGRCRAIDGYAPPWISHNEACTCPAVEIPALFKHMVSLGRHV